MAEAPISFEIVDVTPAMAAGMLAGNSHNRSLRTDYVARLADAMRRGEWRVNGEPVQIALDGTLLNGQHRLQAIVDSNVTVPLLVVRDLPTGTQRTMDTGTRRNLSDVLQLHGETDTANLGAVIGLVHRYRTGVRLDNSNRTAPTSQEALELLAREPGIRDGLAIARRVHRATRMRVSITATLVYLFDEVNPGQGTLFFDALAASDNAPPRSPIRALRSILDRIQNERTYKLSNYVLCAITIKAFNAWLEGREMTLLAFRPGGDKPEPFPAIDVSPDVTPAAA
jgi:hypothetical protein